MIVRTLEDHDITSFIEGMNRANKERASERIPYKELTIAEAADEFKRNTECFGLFRNGNLIGGLLVGYKPHKTVFIKHVWVDPREQNMGGGTFLLAYVEAYLREKEISFMTLSVAECYAPAVHIYRKLGFKTIGVTANIPHTYYFLDMIKAIPPNKLSELKRLGRLAISKIKFSLLFDRYSTPNFLHGMIYGR